MPMPLPDYVQSPIREVILSKYSTGMKGLAQDVGKPYVTVVHTFKRNKHAALKCFFELAGLLRVDTDKLSGIFELPVELRKKFLFEITLSAEDTTVKDLVRHFPEKENYLYGIVKGYSGNQIQEIYKPMARALNMTLEELGAALL